MVKRSILIITAMLALMVAMMGIAAATSYVVGEVKDVDGNLVLGAEVTAYDENDIAFAVPIASVSSTDGAYAITLPDGYIKSTVRVKAIKDSNSGTAIGPKVYQINSPVQTVIYLVNIGNFSIPEFPAVALPIAAVIGLVFFFQQRREQK